MYYRQIIKLDRINICQLLNGMGNFLDVVSFYRDHFLRTLPFLPKKCPMMTGKYYGYNISMRNDSGLDGRQIVSSDLMPNGVYRNIFKLFSNEDQEGLTIWYNTEEYDPKNAGNIM